MYGAVPLLPEAVNWPELPPLHKTSLSVVIVAVILGPLFKTTEILSVQPLASVTVTVYVPAARPLTVVDVEPVFHR